MRAFVCTCGQPLCFDNLRCLACGSDVAYDPHTLRLRAVVPEGSGLWSIAGDVRAPTPRFRLCAHRPAAAVCNWLVPAELPHAICLSCRTTLHFIQCLIEDQVSGTSLHASPKFL